MSLISSGDAPEPEHWLVFRLSSLGDVLLTSGPMLYWHKERGWRFTVLTGRPFAPLFAHNPAVAEVIGLGAGELRTAHLLPFLRALALERQGQGLLDLHGTLRSRMLSFFWRGPVRRYPKLALERRLFLRCRSAPLARRLRACSVTQRYVMTAQAQAPPAGLLLPQIFLTPEEKEAARARLRAAGCPGPRRPIALHPYAAHARKAWPQEYWARLAAILEARGRPWFAVGRGDTPFARDERDFSNRTDLRELCALLAEADVLVSGDSGPVHLAEAVGTPALALFGPTAAEWGFFPAGAKSAVLEKPLPCRPCSLHGAARCKLNGLCLSSISPEEAAARLEDMLAERP
ncbi:MAG: glycosyltransferase family 9 protein [Deltaproteobacteria bacterium]|jgi:ADP-heptose:LPS heptosyltransferase|nr:glycosyltransferase family 9 protein [Deltaproteobacteria bacterium]